MCVCVCVCAASGKELQLRNDERKRVLPQIYSNIECHVFYVAYKSLVCMISTVPNFASVLVFVFSWLFVCLFVCCACMCALIWYPYWVQYSTHRNRYQDCSYNEWLK